MTIAVVDSGFIVALLDIDDGHHTKAISILHDAKWRFYVPSVTLVEVFALRKRIKKPYVPRDVMLRVITEELGFRFEELTLSDYKRVSALLEQYADSEIDFVDAVVVAVAERFRTQYVMTVDVSDFRRYVPNFAEHFWLPLFDS